MRTLRFYCQSISDTQVTVDGPDARHISKVLRLGIGDLVELFDGNGTNADGKIVSVDKKSVSIKIENVRKTQLRKTGRIIIASSIAKSDRFETLIAKCTELGTDSIVPTIYERTVKQASGKNILERYKKIVIESAKQCGLNRLPIITEPKKIAETIENLKTEYPNSVLLFGSLTAGSKSITTIKFNANSQDVIVFIGPEGGLTEGEEKKLKDNNVKPVRMTKTVLRIETATIAVASYLTIKRDCTNNE